MPATGKVNFPLSRTGNRPHRRTAMSAPWFTTLLDCTRRRSILSSAARQWRRVPRDPAPTREHRMLMNPLECEGTGGATASLSSPRSPGPAGIPVPSVAPTSRPAIGGGPRSDASRQGPNTFSRLERTNYAPVPANVGSGTMRVRAAESACSTPWDTATAVRPIRNRAAWVLASKERRRDQPFRCCAADRAHPRFA
jgi:hypothetical protein